MINTKIPLYGIMIILSLIANVIVAFILSKKYKYNNTEVTCLLMYENAGIIFGAKILTFLTNYDKLKGNFNILTLGLSSYGALIGAIIALVVFAIQFKKTLKEILFIFMPSIPLMYAIGKIGCFLAGCCHGIEYNGFGNIVYKYSKVVSPELHLFPVQLVETIFFTLIFIYMMIKHYKNQFNYQTLGISFILCGFSKFILDFLRMSHIGQILSVNQILSLVFILIGTIIVIISKKKIVRGSV